MTEKVGSFCGRHERWNPDGVCAYCEPAPAKGPMTGPVAPTSTKKGWLPVTPVKASDLVEGYVDALGPPPAARVPMTATEVCERRLDERLRELQPVLDRLAQAELPAEPYCPSCKGTASSGGHRPGCKPMRFMGAELIIDPAMRYGDGFRFADPPLFNKPMPKPEDLISCRCGEYFFDRRDHVNRAMYAEGVARAHSPTGCTDIPAKPRSAGRTECRGRVPE